LKIQQEEGKSMRPITDILREIRKGRCVDLASQRFAELIQAVDDTGKPGELTITLLSAIGKGIEVHEINDTWVTESIAWLKQRK
jgi:hypothetical protein